MVKTSSFRGRGSIQQHRLWLSILRFASVTPRNEDVLTEFFMRECAGCPESLEIFLAWLRKYIANHNESTVALHYLRVLSPLAERFGLFSEKNLLDTLCFKKTDPKAFEHMKKLFSRSKKDSVTIVKKINKKLRDLVESLDCSAEVSGRYKHLYSIYRKMQTKNYKSHLSLSDIFAFRIVVHDSDSKRCFDVLNALHDAFHPLADRFKDYISIPKINGYQSIHSVLTDVLPGFDVPIEIQIRTKQMHEFSEHGLASHWLYSRSKRTQLMRSNELKLLQHYKSVADDLKKNDTHYFCITPKGDLQTFYSGATVRDFAASIHSELGKCVQAAVVNGTRVTSDYPLHLGDRVCILTSHTNRTHVS